jgi:hypothetical protein
MIQAPSDLVEFYSIQRPTSLTIGTRTSLARIDLARYEYMLLMFSGGTVGDITLTPLLFDVPTVGQGTAVRLDGTNGQPDERIVIPAAGDNLALCKQLRTAGLPGRYLGFECVVATTTSTFTFTATGFMRGVRSVVPFTVALGHFGFA